MRNMLMFMATFLVAVPAGAVTISCVSEGSGIVRINYDATEEPILPRAFALDLTVDGGAVIENIYDYKVGDSTAESRGFGIFPASIEFDEQGQVSDWGTPDMSGAASPHVQPGLGTAGVTLGMASRYQESADAPPASGMLCRILIDTRGAAGVNVNVAANAFGGGVILEDAATATFTGLGCTLGTSTGPVPPQPPASITYPSQSSNGQYSVRWEASSGATNYQLQRSNNAGGTWMQVYAGPNTSYAETVTNEGAYRYRIRAANSAGFSAWTVGSADCQVSLSSPPAAPLPPASLTFPSQSGTGQYTVGWSASDGATAYQLQRSAQEPGTWTEVYAGAATSYAENVEDGTYLYRVRALNSAGTSLWQTATTPCVVAIAVPPEPPTGAFQQGTTADGIVSMEAEHYGTDTTANGHRWAVISAPGGFSGDGAMRAEPETETSFKIEQVSQSPRLDFEVYFVRTGKHYLWIRGYANGGGEDECHAGFDGRPLTSSDRLSKLPAKDRWVWSNRAKGGEERATFEVRRTGVHTINIWMSEDGFCLDKIVVTTDSSYAPTGDGPAESPRQTVSGGPSAVGREDDELYDDHRDDDEHDDD